MISNVDAAVETLKQGGVICHPCEGVWGFACDPFNESAVKRVLEIKQRPMSKGLILIGSRAEVFDSELENVPSELGIKIKDSWPGHITWILPNNRFPIWISGDFDSVAVRVPDHPQSRDLAEKFGGPLVSTSANRSGQSEATTFQQVSCQFKDLVDVIVDGHIGSSTGPSKIYDALTGSRLR